MADKDSEKAGRVARIKASLAANGTDGGPTVRSRDKSADETQTDLFALLNPPVANVEDQPQAAVASSTPSSSEVSSGSQRTVAFVNTVSVGETVSPSRWTVCKAAFPVSSGDPIADDPDLWFSDRNELPKDHPLYRPDPEWDSFVPAGRPDPALSDAEVGILLTDERTSNPDAPVP